MSLPTRIRSCDSCLIPHDSLPPRDPALTTAAESGRIYFSAITLVEVNYLSGKKSFPYSGVFPRLIALATDPNECLEVLSLTLEIARAMDLVPRDEVPDMPDRIIAATAAAYKLPLVSQDTEIRASSSLKALVPVIW